MKIGIVTIAYNLPQAIIKLYDTAMLDADKHDIWFYLFLHSKHEPTEQACEALVAKYPVKYFPHKVNRGLSTSWNDGMLMAYGEDGADVVIVANDDIFFAPDDINKLATKAFTHRDNYMVSVAGPHLGHEQWNRSHGYSCFALNPIALERIGCFDENIFPVYLEDCDHHRRATLLDLVEENCADTSVSHGGSSAINHDEELALQNLVTQRKSGEYFVRKWGGINEHEKYIIPFNDPRFSCYIDPEVRHNPYGPPYDRTDRYIVAR